MSSSDSLQNAKDFFADGNIVEAAKICQKLLKVNSKDDRVWGFWAEILDKAGDNGNSFNSFIRAIECNPDNPSYYSGAGTQSLKMSNSRDAIPLFEKALELASGNALVHFHLAKAYSYERAFIESEKHFRKSLELEPNHAESYEMLAVILERMNKLDDAKVVLEDGIKNAPEYIDFSFLMAKLLSRDKKYDLALENIDKFLKSKISSQITLSDVLKVSAALTEKAKIMEKTDNYDEAYKLYCDSQKELAKFYNATIEAIKKEAAAKNHVTPDAARPEYFNEVIESSLTYFDTDKVVSWPSEVKSDFKSPVFLVGFPRSGTTLMGNVLAAHPNILTLQEEGLIGNLLNSMDRILGDSELKYPSELDSLNESQIELLRQVYIDTAKIHLKTDDLSNNVIIDKMPFNNVYLGAIYRIFPDAKILSMVRDPRDAVLSSFIQNFNYNPAVAHFSTLETTADMYDKIMNLYFHYRSILPGQSVLEVKYEDLVENLEDISKEIIEFIGEEWNPAILDYYKEENNQYVATPSYEGVMKPMYNSSVNRWQNYSKQIDPLLDKLAPYIEKFNYQK